MTFPLNELNVTSAAEWERYASSARENNLAIEDFLIDFLAPNSKDDEFPHSISRFDFKDIELIHEDAEDTESGYISKDELSDLLDVVNSVSTSTVDSENVLSSYQALLDATTPYYQSLSVQVKADEYVANFKDCFSISVNQAKGIIYTIPLGGAASGSLLLGKLLTPANDLFFTATGYVLGAITGGLVGAAGAVLSLLTADALVSKHKAKKYEGELIGAMNLVGNKVGSRESEFQNTLSNFYDIAQTVPSPERIALTQDADPDDVDKISGLYEKFASTFQAAEEILNKRFEFRLPEYKHTRLYLENPDRRDAITSGDAE